jgi:uncharacterized membrane protein
MFDSQKYLATVSMGYLLEDLIFCALTVEKNDGLMIQTYIHHVVGITGAGLGIYIGGFLGSISQLTTFTEISTVFVNFRTILVYHHADDNIVYAINGLMMTFSFFIVRVLFYYYIIFWKMQDMVMYRFESFWATYD